MARIYKSDAFEAVHQMAEDLYQSGHIDKRTMREFDESASPPPRLSLPRRSARSRARTGFPARLRALSQRFEEPGSDWERGAKRPGGPALRLLTIVRRKGLEAIA